MTKRNQYTDSALVSIYNEKALKQREIHPDPTAYPIIDPEDIKNLPAKLRPEWDQVKNVTNDEDVFRGVNDLVQRHKQIFSDEDVEKRPKLQKIDFEPVTLKQRTEKVNIIKNQPLLDMDSFRSHVRLKGYNIPMSHLKWYVDQEILHPVLTIKDKSWFSPFQLHSLLIIDQVKQYSLQSLNNRESWQDVVLLHKEILIENIESWNHIALFLLDARDLHEQIVNEAARFIFEKDKSNTIKSKRLVEVVDTYTKRFGRSHIDSVLVVHQTVKEDLLQSWLQQLSSKAFYTCPLLQLVQKQPGFLRIIHKQKRTGEIPLVQAGVKNPLLLSLYYLRMVKYLGYFLECQTGERVLDSQVFSALSLREHQLGKLRFCQYCGDEFTARDKERRVSKYCSLKCSRAADNSNRNKRRI